MGVIVAISQVSDGSMLNRHDVLDSQIFKCRDIFLKKHDISIFQTTRLRGNYQRKDYCRYFELQAPFKDHGMLDDNVPIADALITTESGHALFLPIADCIGATFYDSAKHILSVAHLGRHSLEQNGGFQIVEYLKNTHVVDANKLQVWLTPAPGKDVYPIYKLDNKGMKEVIFEQLEKAGIDQANIIDNPADSTKDLDYFSYSEFLKGNQSQKGSYAVVAMMTD